MWLAGALFLIKNFGIGVNLLCVCFVHVIEGELVVVEVLWEFEMKCILYG